MKGKRARKVIITIVVLLLGISTVFYIGLQIFLQRFSKEVSKIEISNIDISKVDDGEYAGKFFVNDSVGATVKVTVIDNKIAKIDFIEHKYGRGKKAEAITNKVIEKQSLDVDVISGATGSSTVILKAIDNALSQGLSIQ